MGDRANVKVLDGDSVVYLYTHWGGTGLPEVLRQALIRGKERWQDGQYLSRIIFCEMIGESDNLKGLTGLGISSVVGDGDDRIVSVNTDRQSIYFYEKKPAISFADYIQRPKKWPERL